MPDSITDLPADMPSQNDTEPLEVDTEGAILAPPPLAVSFAELKLNSNILDSLNKAGFTKPTPIQSQFIPVALTGQDVMGQAKTGTGKTAAFLLPIFQAIKPGVGKPQALILAPTRELALQIHGEIGRLGSFLGFASITLYGGASYEPQIEALSSGVDIVVGTPGRIMDHMRSQRLDLSGIKIAVLDEADRMLDLGFRKDIEYILRHCPSQRQTLLLSATIADDIKKLAQRFMIEPLEVWTSPESLTVDSVEQSFFVCERDEKFPILLKLLEVENPELSIIFCGTKMGAKRLAEKLKRLYINAREIHGDLQQARREKILGRFRTGEVKLLIATDVASRGIDVQNITHIINWDIPYKIEDYVHRIGRTGRIGRSGKAFTFVTREEGSYLTEIELLINKEIKRVHFDDVTSKWWPTPPKEAPPEFVDEGPEPSIAQPAGDKRGKGGRRRSSSSGAPSRSRERAPSRTHSEPVSPTPAAQVDAAQLSGDGAPAEGGADEAAGSRRKRSRRRRGEPVSIVCSQCGVQASVNFKPETDRPVYCPVCYQARKAAKEKAAPSEGNAVESAPTAQ